MYTPPFTVSAQAINMIAEISAQMERFAIRMEQSDGLRLRKAASKREQSSLLELPSESRLGIARANRIKTIHSSLAIEGNTLTESQVTDIIDGKAVIAPLREVQEVKNAIATYELYPSLNPFDVKDLLKAHGTMMMALADDAGHFRRGNVGVFGETGCVHMAPPAERVPGLMEDLFEWLRESQDHLLIRSCVFHYEFEFIHPFSDGNGRTGRLWQSLILGRLNPLFAHLPVENMVFANQQEYYDAIAASTSKADSGLFIDFMLGEILKTLREHQGEERLPNKLPNGLPNNIPLNLPNKVLEQIPVSLIKKFPMWKEPVWEILAQIVLFPTDSAENIGSALSISGRQVRTYIATLREAKLIERVGGNKSGYWKIKFKKRPSVSD